MTKDELLVYCYENKAVIAYCKAICRADWQELKSQLIIQLIKMPEHKIQTAYEKKYLEYLCLTICKRIMAGRVKDSGDFYLNRNNLTLEEGYGLDIADETPTDNDKLEKIDSILNNTHWYNKTLFTYHYKDGYKLREIAEMTGINLKSVAYTINKTKKEIKIKLKEYGNNRTND